MKNRKSIFFLIFTIVSCFCAPTFAQTKSIRIDTTAISIYADNFDNIYLLTPKEEILKYTPDGKLKWRYSNNRFGKIQNIDVSDPLRIVLFYGDFQQVVVLNNNLSEISSYSFASNSNLLIAALASSNNNGFWAFDRTNNCLIKLSSNFTEAMRSANLSQIFEKPIVPKKLVASDQFVYLQQIDNQILQFDQFGAFIKPLAIDSLSDFNITTNKIAYLFKSELIQYDPITFEISKQKLLLEAPIKQVTVGNKIVAALTEKAVFLLTK